MASRNRVSVLRDYLTETNKERLDQLGWKARRDAVSQELRRIRNQEGAPTLIEIGVKAGAEGLGIGSLAVTLTGGENPTQGGEE